MMNDYKFNQLILDVYKEWKNPKRTRIIQGDLGWSKCTNFSGYICSKISEVSFKDIENIEKSINVINPELLVLKSAITNQEIGIHKHDMDNYIIDEDILIIEREDKRILFQM